MSEPDSRNSHLYLKLSTMKTIAFLFLLSPIIALSQPDIPNGEFEEWELANTWNLTPVDWITQNNQLIVHTEPDSMPCAGDLAMRVKSLPGFEGGVPGISSTMVELDAIPPSLDFCVKCNIDNEGFEDTVRVSIAFFNENIPDDPVYEETWISTQDIVDWTEVSLELEQIEPVIDYATITVMSGFIGPLFGGGWETWISVDNLTFGGGPNNIVNLDHNQIKVFPNPGQDFVSIQSDKTIRDITIYDSSGKILEAPLEEALIDVRSLPAGLYYLSIILDDGTMEDIRWIKN